MSGTGNMACFRQIAVRAKDLDDACEIVVSAVTPAAVGVCIPTTNRARALPRARGKIVVPMTGGGERLQTEDTLDIARGERMWYVRQTMQTTRPPHGDSEADPGRTWSRRPRQKVLCGEGGNVITVRGRSAHTRSRRPFDRSASRTERKNGPAYEPCRQY